jgi:hypothetical protein
MANPGLKIRQFQHESDSWKRTLEFLMHENSILQNRLAEVLNTTIDDNDILPVAEQYQNRFVQEDEYIHLIRKEIAEQDRLLLKDTYSDGELFYEIIRKHKKLSAEMQNIIKEFNKIRFDFNSYLGEVL